MINLDNKKIAEVLYQHITHESLDSFIIDPVLLPYENNEEIHDIIACAINDTSKEYFKLGYLLAKL
jgi:DNA-binding protein YbaB